MRQLGLPARLTLGVTAVFAVTVGLISVVLLQVVQERLVADTRANTEVVLADYLDRLYQGEATIGAVDVDEATRFFYLDDDGEPLTEAQFFEQLERSFSGESSVVPEPSVSVRGPEGENSELLVDPSTGQLLEEPSYDGFGYHVDEIFAVPVGAPEPVDLGAEVVAVAQDLTIGGADTRVGVSSPLQPVQNSLDTVRWALWFVVPLLVAAVGVLTWLTTSRALRPVDVITRRVRDISHTNMDERVPVQERNDQIRRLAITMNDMLERLDSSQRRQRQLVADASHELRSPIAVSRAQLDVARADPESADWSETAEVVAAEQEHLTDLVDDLLALSRLDEFGVGQLVDVDLDDIVATEADRPRDIEVRVTAPEPVRLQGDPQQLTRALRNLLDNAIAHAVDEVQIALTTTSEEAVVTVDDDGPGIPPDDRERVFERFTRLDEARDRHRGGTGLGLAIARQVARAHDGDIMADESSKGGARFTMTLPRQDPDQH